MSRTEPKAVADVHKIRERHHDERKNWTREQLLDHYKRVGDELASKLGLRTVEPGTPKRTRKAG